MINKKISITNKLGLHARAAAKLVRLASQFSSNIELQTSCKTANGKSIMSIMMLAAGQGAEISLIIDGDDEKKACSALTTLIKQRFDEKE
ncbi:MAG: HPr family phosphocarrier protein [gamma proteobacterium symbiont of Taylorina sp.]|nr:HPr family phosphocarrier protein [gamma proteobacterium symbiont of Taylorina sp.]